LTRRRLARAPAHPGPQRQASSDEDDQHHRGGEREHHPPEVRDAGGVRAARVQHVLRPGARRQQRQGRGQQARAAGARASPPLLHRAQEDEDRARARRG
jgi:hypothetical protein